MASVNGSSRRPEFGCSQKRAASEVEIGLLSNDPNAGANSFVRGAHHRRCAREGLTCIIMPYFRAGCKLAGLRFGGSTVRKPGTLLLIRDRKYARSWF